MLMVAGIFTSRYGSKQAIFIGLCFAATGFTGLALSDNYWLSMTMMALLGFGTAFGYTPLISLLGSWYPEKRGAVIGFANSGVGLGLFLAGVLVPFLTTTWPDQGWRLVWAVFGVSAVLAGVVVGLFLRNPPRGGGSGGPADPVPAARSGVYRNPHVINVGLIYGIVGLTYIVQTIFMYSFALESGIPSLIAGRLAAAMGLLGLVAGLGAPIWYISRTERDEERLEELRAMNRANYSATGEYMTEVSYLCTCCMSKLTLRFLWALLWPGRGLPLQPHQPIP
jgi:MFS family permease